MLFAFLAFLYSTRVGPFCKLPKLLVQANVTRNSAASNLLTGSDGVRVQNILESEEEGCGDYALRDLGSNT